MDRKRWMFVLVTLLLAAGFAIAADPATAPAVTGVAAILAAGAGAWWKGALTGVTRGLYGFFSTTTPGVKFDGKRLISAAIAGAIAGSVANGMGLSFENASGYLASFGITEIILKGVTYVWDKYLADKVGEAAARSLSRGISKKS